MSTGVQAVSIGAIPCEAKTTITSQGAESIEIKTPEDFKNNSVPKIQDGQVFSIPLSSLTNGLMKAANTWFSGFRRGDSFTVWISNNLDRRTTASRLVFSFSPKSLQCFQDGKSLASSTFKSNELDANGEVLTIQITRPERKTLPDSNRAGGVNIAQAAPALSESEKVSAVAKIIQSIETTTSTDIPKEQWQGFVEAITKLQLHPIVVSVLKFICNSLGKKYPGSEDRNDSLTNLFLRNGRLLISKIREATPVRDMQLPILLIDSLIEVVKKYISPEVTEAYQRAGIETMLGTIKNMANQTYGPKQDLDEDTLDRFAENLRRLKLDPIVLKALCLIAKFKGLAVEGQQDIETTPEYVNCLIDKIRSSQLALLVQDDLSSCITKEQVFFNRRDMATEPST